MPAEPYEPLLSRRTLRDLVAITSLPAMWLKYDARNLAQTLADLLLNTLTLDFVYLNVRGFGETEEVKAAAIAAGPATAKQLDAVAAAIAPYNIRETCIAQLSNPIASGTVNIVLVPIGIEEMEGVLVAASSNSHFPAENARVLLTVAANQAAIVLQRRRSEEALRLSEERFRRYFDLGLIGMAITSPTKGCIAVNDETCRILGYSREELLKKAWAEITHPDDLDADMAQFQRVLAAETDGYSLDKRFIHKDGRVIHTTISVKCLRRENGSVDCFVALMQDITERKCAEEALREANARLDLAMRGSNIGIWENQFSSGGDLPTSQVTLINILEPLGYEVSEIAANHIRMMELVHPDHRERVERESQAYLARGTGEFEIEHPMRHKDGSYRWVLCRGVAVRDAAGKPVRFAGTLMDITERRRYSLRQRAIADAAAKINTSLSVAQPLNATLQLLIDEVRQIIGANVAIAEVSGLGASQQSIMLASLSEWLKHAGKSPLMGELDRLSPEARLSVPLLARDGQQFGVIQFADKSEGPFTPEDEAIAVQLAAMGAVAIENWGLYQKTQEADRHKDEFVAHVSHEIRTPMSGIVGMTELALQTPLTEIQRTYLTTVKASSSALLNVINDLLDFSKIQAGKLTLDPSDFSLRTLLGEVLRAMAVGAHKKGLELMCDVDPTVPDALIGDAGRLRQVLLNLIGNATKFTQQGEIMVCVSASAEAEQTSGSVRLFFEVQDTGIGIPADRQQLIFNAFEQADRATTRRFGGTGLGLSIASRLAALMDGKLTVDSRAGEGSTFRFTLSLPRQHDSSPPAPPDLGRLKVLIVDDDHAQRQMLEKWLRDCGADPRGVGAGLDALSTMIRAAADGQPFSLVLLDANMPDVDSLALANKIVAEMAKSQIILMTTQSEPDLAMRLSKPSVAAVVLKPLLRDELVEAICRVLAGLNERVGEPQHASGREVYENPAIYLSPDTSASQPLSVLLAEDNIFNQEVIRHLLERKGHSVRTVTDGRQALTVLERDPFDLLLLDCHMPEVDGFQVVADLRQRERDTHEHLPVIGLTALSMEGDRERCLRAGMDAYLSKPIRPAEFLTTIDRVLGAMRPSSNTNLENHDEALVDVPRILASCGGDAGLLSKMIDSFKSQAQKHLERLWDAIDREDPLALSQTAHKFSGLVSAFSASGTQELAILEEFGGKRDLSGAAEHYQKLANIVEHLSRLLPRLANVSVAGG